MTPQLPDGFVVRLGRHVRRYDNRHTLVGGSPTTVLHLTNRAVEFFADRDLRVIDAASRVLADRLLDLGMADPVIDVLPEVDPSLVTVVIPIRDRPAQLDRLLASIGKAYRTIVVDDCSAGRVAIAAVAAAHGAELVTLPTNLGPAGARNEGLRLVRSPFVAFVDSDVVLDAATIPTLLKHFHDGRVGAAAPRILGWHAPGGTTWITRYEDSRSSLDLGRNPSVVRPRAPVAWVPAACLVARVAAAADGFSADLRVAEDVDLVWRLSRAGWRVRYEPAAVVRHEHRARLRDWWIRKAYYGTGAHLLARRHGHDAAPAILTPWSAAVIAALLAQRRWSLPVAAAVSATAAVRIARKLDRSGSSRRIGTTLTANGIIAALEQTSALALRHWWPLAAAGSLVSPRLRRAVLVLGAVDAAVEFIRSETDLDPVSFTVARRLDDLAYGSGVWLGAARGRSPAALLPHVVRRHDAHH